MTDETKYSLTLAPLIVPVYENGTFRIETLLDPSWNELENIFSKHRVSVPLSFLPPELYLEMLFYYACKRTKLPATHGTAYTLELTRRMVESGFVDCIVSTSKVVSFLIRALTKEERGHIKTIVLVGEKEDDIHVLLTELCSHTTVSCITHPLYEHA